MWKSRKNTKEKSPTPANKPKIPAADLAVVASVVVVEEVVVDVVGVSGVAELIYILESDFREACLGKVWTMKSIPH
jgi:hypothetical protein